MSKPVLPSTFSYLSWHLLWELDLETEGLNIAAIKRDIWKSHALMVEIKSLVAVIVLMKDVWGGEAGLVIESPHGDIGLILIIAKCRRSGIEQGKPLMEMQKSDGSRLSCCVPDF